MTDEYLKRANDQKIVIEKIEKVIMELNDDDPLFIFSGELGRNCKANEILNDARQRAKEYILLKMKSLLEVEKRKYENL